MKVEILFPEFCNLFGDIGNVKYLKLCLPDAEFFETSFSDTPAFIDNNIDFIYMGAMTERVQEKIILKLAPHKERLTELIENGAVFLFTGNAFEILGKNIRDGEKKIDCIGIFDLYAERDMMNRFSGLVHGKFEDIDITGFRAQFTMCYPASDSLFFMKVVRGDGMNSGIKFEGIRRNNFFGTYLIGPFLVLNPDFTRYLFSLIDPYNTPDLIFKNELYDAYKRRLSDFINPKIKTH